MKNEICKDKAFEVFYNSEVLTLSFKRSWNYIRKLQKETRLGTKSFT